MKSIILKYSLIAVLGAGFITSCANDDDYDTPSFECDPGITANVRVDSLAAVATATPRMYGVIAPGDTIEGIEDDIIEAYVTSSDERGNFFKTISLQTMPTDANPTSIGFSIAIDQPGLFTEGFVPGVKVYIKLAGLYFSETFGSLKLGGLYQQEGEPDEVGRISVLDYRDHIFISNCSTPTQPNIEEDLVQVMTIDEALNDANINKLIELKDVQFTEQSFGYTLHDDDAPTSAGNPQLIGGATNHNLVDAAGNTIIFRTSSFANFAGTPVPQGSGNVRGVLTNFCNGSGECTYQFMARYESDIRFEADRLPEPFFFEDFQDAVDNTDFNFPGWFNIIESGTRKWSEQAFEGNGYAEFSSFGSGNALNVAWLVTPAINMDTHNGEVLSFQTAQHHLDGDTDGNKLEVFIVTSFNGTDIVGATKVDITDSVELPTTATDWYEFVASGGVDLSGYTGTIHIAFKFTGSGSNTALDGAFQIDNLGVSGSEL